MARYIPTLSLLVFLAGPLCAGTDFGAEFKVQQQVLLSRDGDSLERAFGRSTALTTSSLRLKAQGNRRSWSYDAHYLFEGGLQRRIRRPGAAHPSDAEREPLEPAE